MKWSLTKQDAEKIFNSWSSSKPLALVEGEAVVLREELITLFNNVLKDLSLLESQVSKKKNYQVDLEFGLKLFHLLEKYKTFNMRTASNNDFWRFLSISVIPDVVYLRWGLSETRFWKEPRRIWLKTIWWYIYLSWQGSIEDTKEILKDNTTDEIVQLVERAGTNGYRVDLAREIMKIYGSFDKEKKSRNQSIFRKVMKLNTAKVETIEPAFHLKGEQTYARQLFEYFEQ
jgi:hypothetical protein